MSDRVPLNEHAAAAAQRRRIAPEHFAAAQAISAGTTTDPEDQLEVDELEKRRRNRKPFGSLEQKLQFPDRPGYHRHWFNDDPGRLARAEEAGYSQVNDEHGKPVHCVVGISRGGGPLTAYLREIPLQWYQDDMAAQENVVLELMRQIKRGEFERPGGADGAARYAGSSKGDISIRESYRR